MDIIFLIYTIIKMIVYPRQLQTVIISIAAILLCMEFYGIYLILKKIGRKAYKAFIPLYDLTEIYDLVWERKYSCIYIAFALLSAILGFTKGRLMESGLRGFLSILCFIIGYSVHIFMKLKFCRSFKLDIPLTYGLIFMEAVFFFIIGRSQLTYLGPCVSTHRLLLKKPQRKDSIRPKRSYMITLYKRRSIIALAAGILVVYLNFRAISDGLINQYIVKAEDEAYTFLNYFTVNSALLSSLGAAFMIPYAIEGIRKKRFVLPKWVTLFQYAGACCTSITMVFAFTFIYLSSGPETAFGGPNFWMHVVCPILSLALFFSVEIDRTLSVNDSLIGMSPFFIYSLFYQYNAILLGVELGGWDDFYKFAQWIPATFSLPMVFIFAFLISSLIRLVYNRLSKMRIKQFIDSLGSNVSDIEANIEMYGLGRYNGKHLDILDLTIPVDIFNMLHDTFGMDIEKLSAVYNKGVMDGLKERKESKNRFLTELFALVGKPKKKA